MTDWENEAALVLGLNNTQDDLRRAIAQLAKRARSETFSECIKLFEDAAALAEAREEQSDQMEKLARNITIEVFKQAAQGVRLLELKGFT